ncbi:4Fe-4S binding protein [Treponema sp. OttesenSCG-928-L16]|nr:4Fe-4S binding protein [Treponema sp. OttesenSCG-928-L16]
MDAKTCIEKLRLIASVSMATVGTDGSPQVRTIGVMHVEDEKLYFLTARGKPFYHELLEQKKVAILGLSRFKEMIRLNGVPELLPQAEQDKWLSLIFEENPYMANVYPGNTRQVLGIFCVEHGAIEYFHLGVRPIVRESYVIGNGAIQEKLFCITQDCTGCGTCVEYCPQNCITAGMPYRIEQGHCLRCGACEEICPVSAIRYGRHSQ